MEVDRPTTEKTDSDSELNSAPSTKKQKTNVVDPIKALLGKAQLFLNPDFIFFYKNVGLFKTEEEWEIFSTALYTELPTTFRITSTTSFTQIAKTYMDELFCGEDVGVYELGGKVVIEKPTELPWYPQGLAYHFGASRKSLRTSPLTKHLKHFLTHETEIGNVSRQEAVSMVPPLLLDVKSHHKVLDMCAAPGSKTCQLLEMLHKDTPDQQTPSGFVMANDANIARCYLLAHQVHRLSSPAVLVTHYDATQFPLIQLAADDATGKPSETLLFDRILCDVPCSGDGTIRKNPSAGSGWDSSKPFKLFKLQLSIAQRSAQLLKVGGRMVYSTCAFNPIEDEAVVAQLLRESKGALRIIDVFDQLPELIRKPGVCSWQVIDGKQRIYKTPADIPERARARVPEAVFPPTEEECAEFHLERCWRFYPHLQDTGGFFVAVLEKTGETHFNLDVPGESMRDLGLEEDGKAPKPERGFSEEPFYTVPPTIMESIKDGLRSYYGLKNVDDPEFSHLLIRSPNDPYAPVPVDASGSPTRAPLKVEDVNMIYKVSEPVHDLLNRTRDHRFVSAGIRFLENFSKRNKHLSLDCDWRITAEGLSAVTGALTRRVITVGLEDFRTLLRVAQPKFEEFTAPLREHLETIVKDGVGVVSIHLVPEPASDDELAKLSAREKLIRTTPQWVMGWLGGTSFTLAIRKLELKSWRNYYLTSDYTHEFDPRVNNVPPEEKAALIASGRARKIERDEARKTANREAKAKRRNDRRMASNAEKQDTPTDAPISESPE